jgi:hypothetical protein
MPLQPPAQAPTRNAQLYNSTQPSLFAHATRVDAPSPGSEVTVKLLTVDLGLAFCAAIALYPTQTVIWTLRIRATQVRTIPPGLLPKRPPDSIIVQIHV